MQCKNFSTKSGSEEIPPQMYLNLVDLCFPAVIIAASCDFDNKKQSQTLLMT